MSQNVLILGAGASSHYDFPVASALVDSAIQWRGSQAVVDMYQGNIALIEEFADQLQRSGCTSIDQYVSSIKREPLRNIGKQLMALFLAHQEAEHKLYIRNGNHWYERAANRLIIPGHLDRFPAYDIGVITFNYDRSFERYLLTALLTRFRDHHRPDEIIKAFKRLPIIHIYGSLGELPELVTEGRQPRAYGPIANAAELEVAVGGMQLLGEGDPLQPGSGIAKAQELLVSSAGDVVFLGFGYSDDNLGALNLKRNVSGEFRQILGTIVGYGSKENQEALMLLINNHGRAFKTRWDVDVATVVRDWPVSVFGPPKQH
jgi:hypothetical protein